MFVRNGRRLIIQYTGLVYYERQISITECHVNSFKIITADPSIDKVFAEVDLSFQLNRM